MTTGSAVLHRVLDSQQRDGSWPNTLKGSGIDGSSARLSSWTEPTCYAILALHSAGRSCKSVSRAVDWLAAQQRRDGGWPPGR